MLSLVAYDASDSEEDYQNEPDDIESNSTVEKTGSVQVIPKPTQLTNGSVKSNASSQSINTITNGDLVELTKSTETSEEETVDSDIFVSLPQPHSIQIESVHEEEEDEFLKKKEVPTEKPKKQAIKISVPSLAQFESDDEDDESPAKKPKISSKTSGLFALLPPPKTAPLTTKHFVPNSVKRNMNGKLKPTPKKALAQIKKEIIKNIQESDDDDEDVDLKAIPDTYDDDIWQKVCGKKEKRVPKPIISDTPETMQIVQPDPEVQKPYDGLDNQAFKELLGGNSKRKSEPIDLIEIKEDEILSDKDVWMTRSLTDPELAPKYVVKNPVNDTCKRKHHITYLAQQAKANEQELQNQWASSRYTRQKTQAKYGF